MPYTNDTSLTRPGVTNIGKQIPRSNNNVSFNATRKRTNSANLVNFDKRSSSFTLGSMEEYEKQSKSGNVLAKLMRKLNLESQDQLYPRVKELKTAEQFSESIIEIVRRCVPPTYFVPQKSVIKQCWNFIKKVLEKYSSMKKSLIKFDAYQEILNDVVKSLGCQELSEVVPKLLNVLFERDIMKRIIEKTKCQLRLEWATTLPELERAMDIENTDRVGLQGYQKELVN